MGSHREEAEGLLMELWDEWGEDKRPLGAAIAQAEATLALADEVARLTRAVIGPPRFGVG